MGSQFMDSNEPMPEWVQRIAFGKTEMHLRVP
jgi:hypothetical protein